MAAAVAMMGTHPHIAGEVSWLAGSSGRERGVPDIGDDPDRCLLRRMAQGDVEALRRLYDEYSRRAMAIAMRVLRSQTEAEDVVQETFLEVWRRADQFDN